MPERRNVSGRYNDDEQKIVDQAKTSVIEGEAYASLLQHYGWKLLEERFIRPALSRNNFFSAKEEELPAVRVKMKAYMDMLQYIQSKVNEANIGVELLSKLNIPKEEARNV